MKRTRKQDEENLNKNKFTDWQPRKGIRQADRQTDRRAVGQKGKRTDRLTDRWLMHTDEKVNWQADPILPSPFSLILLFHFFPFPFHLSSLSPHPPLLPFPSLSSPPSFHYSPSFPLFLPSLLSFPPYPHPLFPTSFLPLRCNTKSEALAMSTRLWIAATHKEHRPLSITCKTAKICYSPFHINLSDNSIPFSVFFCVMSPFNSGLNGVLWSIRSMSLIFGKTWYWVGWVYSVCFPGRLINRWKRRKVALKD